MKLWLILLVAGAALEISHARVFSGDASTSIEGTLANIDELSGANLRVGIILLAAAAYFYFKRT